jgi:hypothetical protein
MTDAGFKLGSCPLPLPPANPRDPDSAFRNTLLTSPPATARYTSRLPVHDLTAAEGFRGPESVPKEVGWTGVPGVSLKSGMFVAGVTGAPMEPVILDGARCLLCPYPAGSRESRIVLVQLGTDGAGENGGRLTVKTNHSETKVTAEGW